MKDKSLIVIILVTVILAVIVYLATSRLSSRRIPIQPEKQKPLSGLTTQGLVNEVESQQEEVEAPLSPTEPLVY